MDQPGGDLHHDDLAWARALATGDRDALARYERELVPLIAAALRKRGHSTDEIADIQQTLRARLFVGDGDGPAIASYAGTGALRSWVMIIALREAIRSRQRSVREPAVEDDALVALADRTDIAPPALDKERYRDAFREAFRSALAQLTPRDRNLLRLHLVDNLTIDQIGGLQGVHRATAARWIDRARGDVALAVRRELMRRLGADPFETDDLLRWVQSRIDLSLSGLAPESKP
ncbi:MAG TPA: sigma-70 family RNA polymerase sigma factor [Kofleriaceae bacterium]|nr:sigma-70 family RNA polymerase sigma factor [Kofleriaceae bacterium]